MRFDVITIFPEYFSPLSASLLGKAADKGLLSFGVHDLRDWAYDRHRTVDDTPYGGGPGMVMKPAPWGEALDDVLTPESRLVVPTPSGRPFTQAVAGELASAPHLVFACGRYEGIDSRVMAHYRDVVEVHELSIGDYVLAGGEVAVLVMVEAVSRLVPGVLGNAESVSDDSFAPGRMETLVEGPVYTKPPVWRDREVPAVLKSGHHGKIARWRRDEAFRRTAALRPDLLARLDPKALDKHDRRLLAELGLGDLAVPGRHALDG
ncbi:tRNA (guanine37-N(1)-) methyltransferase [Actinocorallia herbida]|uniref:tRNA (guanine-N(1)-)-methyltransferase n=1 Tax=Actinocorallia herbida TaxID=58109 RepID=A0A3N1CQ10_9ACTN|nr:tRNA (guanosine(37)-N1)-methyltransferase TrmD [Actinocorallia herbida]ROO83401.1 tRNA (guanine37-N(1)-) methyltransferase [Actinocorallia herbida]